ncbi:APH(3'') family aminoglycoside O-phosphotransferase [Streptomyces sp. BE147]|uniref:APH(3'') family aminoglycoside O-phosphotransferase n=1 Tax=Streptomyces sp. BE147 TaxID=3002524 RepID=UPI002E7A4321|nr:APH(3'') family aminoglycoside O-phosphotransferase [Streptomyces sp. BE147]MEE1740322.1 APH(3'') family aminoglycoside O-phosphotransferase [Streptomyces sp. BE147]
MADVTGPSFGELLRDGGWEPVAAGESDAAVFRSADGSRFAKCVPADRATPLEEERDRVAWLSRQGVPGPRVLDWRVTADGARLVTSAVVGVPADRVPAPELRAAWGSIADAVRRLHGLPLRRCPFTRDLARMMARARDVVARGAVDPEFLPEDQRRTPPGELLARLVPELDRRLAQEAAEAVVCHGDLCLPNIILDPETMEVAGFIDLGRLGAADPYADIALLLANSRETWTDARQARIADEAFADRYGIVLDRDRERFYLHLDPLTWG